MPATLDSSLGTSAASTSPAHQATKKSACHLRPKAEILARADLLYRLHWAVRNAQYPQTAPPVGVNGGVVQEWHRAVNWVIRYNDEDNWDHVGTDT